MNDYDALFQSIKSMAGSLQSLNRQAVQEYTPVVESILRSRSCDTHHIEQTLDGLLGFCGYAPALVLYKILCRRYWEIDQGATAYYIDAYREMWESNEDEPTGESANKPDRNDA